MNRLKYKIALLAGALLIWLTPVQAAFAADNAIAATDADAAFAFKVAYNNGRYAVYMQPNASPEQYNLTLTGQVTLKVPHGVDADSFKVIDIQNGVQGANWSSTSRINAPSEDQNADYISFTVEFPEGNHQAYQWKAGEEIEVFSFANEGTCLGSVALLDNSDPFMAPVNSANTNPGNQIDVLGFREGNLYANNYGDAANCGAEVVDVDTLINKIFMPLVNR